MREALCEFRGGHLREERLGVRFGAPDNQYTAWHYKYSVCKICGDCTGLPRIHLLDSSGESLIDVVRPKGPQVLQPENYHSLPPVQFVSAVAGVYKGRDWAHLEKAARVTYKPGVGGALFYVAGRSEKEQEAINKLDAWRVRWAGYESFGVDYAAIETRIVASYFTGTVGAIDG